jgi:endonuclease-3 related protein
LLLDIYAVLLEKQGFQHWWPGDTDLEVCVGAILTQNTSWSNVEKAICNIKAESLMSLEALLGVEEKKVATLIKSAGYFNQKAKYLYGFCEFLKKNPFNELKKKELLDVRQALLGIKGIGKETADSILLYALDFPIFVVDAYTKRIFSRIGICNENIAYDDIQNIFHKKLVTDIELFKDYHAQIVMLGKNTCHQKPRCKNCILREQKICSYGLDY